MTANPSFQRTCLRQAAELKRWADATLRSKMTLSEPDELAKLVNRSGFLFQLAVEDHVRATENEHDWKVIAREYPWLSRDESRGGFIDFIADRGGLPTVFECKRTQGGEWIFLVPKASTDTPRLRTLWSYLAQDGSRGWGWDDLLFDPATLSAEFCIVRGGSDDDKPMLERIAGELVRASESLAREELGMRKQRPGPSAYIPVIVTNARLVVCRVEPRDVDLASGTLPEVVTFEEANAIRFRKALVSDLKHEPNTYESIDEGLILKERSVFVVNAKHVAGWLKSIRQRQRGLSGGREPWWQLGP